MPLRRMRERMEPKRAPIDYNSGHSANKGKPRMHDLLHKYVTPKKRTTGNQNIIKEQITKIEKELFEIDKTNQNVMLKSIFEQIIKKELKDEVQIMIFLEKTIIPAVQGYVNEIKRKKVREN